MIALLAAAHLYLFQWPGEPPKALFLLPTEGENACGVANLVFGAPDGSWSGGTQGPKTSCEFRQWVDPGKLLPAWVDAGKITPGAEVEVTWTFQGGGATGKGHATTLRAEEVPADSLKASAAGLSGTATKAKNDARVEVKNGGAAPVLLGDAVAARGKPEDSCVGSGPQVLLEEGETLVDLRPGLISKSMRIWAAAFTGPKQCHWVEVRRR
ncbi:MAG TPA: hypothetical protein VIH41_07535 [Myxococcales bacterium]